MQELLLELDDSAIMAEQKIDLQMLARIDSDQKATSSRVDKIDEKLQGLAREVSEIKGAIRLPTETPAWIRFVIYPLCVGFVIAMTGAVVRVTIQMGNVEHSLKDNSGFIAALRLEKANPTDPNKIQEAKQILFQAQKTDVKIPLDVIAETGIKFIDASKDNPNTWDTALAFVDYRSYLNLPNPPISGYYPIGKFFPADGLEPTYYFWGTVPGKPLPQFTTSVRRVPIAVSARTELIKSPMKQLAHEGPESLLGVGGDLRLEGYYFRNVVLKEVTVHYNGGPIILDNVTFINCRFVIDNIDNGRALSSQILASSQVNFKTPTA